MYINKHNCFFGICPFIWSTLSAPANTSAKFSNHNTQEGNTNEASSDMHNVLNYFAASLLTDLKPPKFAITSSCPSVSVTLTGFCPQILLSSAGAKNL